MNMYMNCPCQSGKKFKFCCNEHIKNPNALTSEKALSNLPLVACHIGKNWKESGISPIIVLRKLSDSTYLCGQFLIDFWCLGVKDAFTRILDDNEVKKLLTGMDKNCQGITTIEYETARSIILGSINFANNIGFTPHKDWQQAKYIIEPTREFNDSIKFGKDGKPFYFQGPYDTNVEAIVSKVLKAGGNCIQAL